jgi:hypothetical protein
MVVGTVVCSLSWYYSLIGKECHNDKWNLCFGALMYSSYFGLFVQFALKRFVYKEVKVKNE